MDRKPLSYESLKSVLQHMGPNARFQIRQNCPSIRITEGLVPLKINELELNPYYQSITVDGTSYKLGIITHYDNADDTPDSVQETNSCGGVVYDVNRYGLKGCTEDVTPGDMMLESMERFYYEKGGEVDKQIKELKEFLLYHRHDIVQPRLTNYLQLSIEGSDDKIENMEYNRKLEEAMKYLTSKLLGGRSQPILVNHLVLKSSGCFRLPYNLKLVIQKMSLLPKGRGTLDAFLSVLQERSFPLKTIFMNAENNFDHQIIKSAGKLDMRNIGFRRLALIEKVAFSHPRVHFEKNSYSTEHIFHLVNKWHERGRDIGTHYSFEIEKKYEVYRILNSIEKTHDAKFGEMEKTRLSPFRKCVTVPLNDYSEINIHGEGVKKNGFGLLRWVLHVKIHPIGQATPLNVKPPPAKRAKLSQN